MLPLNASTFATRPAAAYPDLDRLYLKAMRHWVLIARAGRNPRHPLAALLGERLAGRFCLLMELCVGAWPEPFTTFPPCACQCSPDETTLLALLGYSEAGVAEPMHAMLQDMIPQSMRDRLWYAASTCTGERLGG